MKSFLLILICLTNTAFASKSLSEREANLLSQLKAKHVSILKLKRTYFHEFAFPHLELLLDGEWQYKIKIQIDDYTFKCNTGYVIKKDMHRLEYCSEVDDRSDFDHFIKGNVKWIYF